MEMEMTLASAESGLSQPPSHGCRSDIIYLSFLSKHWIIPLSHIPAVYSQFGSLQPPG